jgi:hypothetical protein
MEDDTGSRSLSALPELSRGLGGGVDAPQARRCRSEEVAMSDQHFTAQRTCQRKGCSNDLSGYRSDARYCSEACAKAAKRAASADKARTRRKSRDGLGTRVYLTAQELWRLQQSLMLPLGSGDDGLSRKILRARRRAKLKEGAR